MPRNPAARAVALGALPVLALALAACGPTTSDADSPPPRGGGGEFDSVSPSRSLPPSPSDPSPSDPSPSDPSPSGPCPTGDQVVAAINGDTSGITAPNPIVCEGGYAETTVEAAQTDPAMIILHYEGGQWHEVVLGTSICQPDPDGSRPEHLEGVPDKVLEAAHCDPSNYTD